MRMRSIKEKMNSSMLVNRMLIIIVMVAGFAIIGFYVYFYGISISNYTAEEFYDFYTEEQKEMVRQEVQTHVDAINYEKSLVEKYQLEKVKHEILHISDILRNDEVTSIEDFDIRQSEAVRVFEALTSYDESHLYFILSSDGVLLKSGADRSKTGTDLTDTQDVNGVYLARNILMAMERPEGVFTSYHWPKEDGGQPLRKTSFCYYLPEFDFVVGAGVYLEDILSEVESRVYDRLNVYYATKENYVFVYSYDGTILVGPNESVIGDTMLNLLYEDGRPLHNVFMEIINKEGSGYLTYAFSKKSDPRKYDKISYITALEGWDAYIGMGFYTDDIAGIYSQYEAAYKELHSREVATVFILFLMIVVVVFLLVIRGNSLQKLFLKKEEASFTVLFSKISSGVVVVGTGQVLYANKIAKEYFEDQLMQRFSGESLGFTHFKDDIYKTDEGDGNRYFEITSKNIYFRGVNAKVHFANDVTKSYKELTAYQELTLFDELTGLPNRRALKEDFQKSRKEGRCDKVVGMIDLDHFKAVNDTYGHAVGDEVLMEISEVFSTRLRRNDRFYRYGGEEFVVVMSELTIQEAKKILENINRMLDTAVMNGFGFHQTFSGGLITTNCLEADSLEDMIKKADELLYLAKSSGRNQIRY